METKEAPGPAPILELNEETVVMASGTMWQNLGSIALKFISFIYTIIIARLVSQDDVGLFYFALGIIGMIGIFADLGLCTSLQRYVPYYLGKKDKVSADRIIRLTLTLSPLFLLTVSLLTFALAPALAGFFHNPGLEPVLVLLAVYLSISQVVNACVAVLTALKRMKESSIAYSVQNALKVALTLALVFGIGASAKALVLAFILSYVPIGFYLILITRKALKPIDTPTPFPLSQYGPMLREIIPFGLTMVGVVLFSSIVTYTDRMMLGFFIQTDANAKIAIYTMATNFAGLATLFAASVLAMLFPMASELVGRGDRARLNQTAQTAMRWVLFSSVPLVVFMVAFSGPILRILYGAAYEPGALALALFSIGMLAGLLGAVQRTTLAGMRLIKIELLSVAIGALVNVWLNILFVPLWGINGAAFASLIAFIVMSAVNQHFANKYSGFLFPPSAWKNLAAGLLAFLPLAVLAWFSYPYLTSLSFAAADQSLAMLIGDKFVKVGILGVFFCLAGLFYVMAINLLHLPQPEDTQVMRRILSRMPIPPKLAAMCVRLTIWDARHHLGGEKK
ncbi:MAG: flippase [Candidatus Marsarchaeota archaeon]|nr:flippase [Candidatus Marsarchaeota archaeon]